MLFSIIVPIFNVEQYLEQCISSLITQDISNYEIILIDDCSTDKSGIIAQEWSKKDSKISYYRKKVNSGLSDTRNYGIKVAKSDYILFIDSDDYIDKNVLGSLKSIIIKNNRPDIVYLGYYLEKQGKYEKKYNYFCDKNVLMNSRQFMKKELQQRNLPIAACFAVYRRQYIIDHTLLFKTGIYHEDELWSPQILYNSNLVYISDMIFYHYVIRQGSITTSKDKTKNGIDLLDICNELIIFSNTIKDEELRKLLQNRIAMVYMKAVYIGKLYRKEFRNCIDKKFPLHYSYFIKDKSKSIIFYISRYLYCLINDMK